MIIMIDNSMMVMMIVMIMIQVNTSTPAGLTPLMLACLREDVAVVGGMNIVINTMVIIIIIIIIFL